jgi:hypothetical protein
MPLNIFQNLPLQEHLLFQILIPKMIFALLRETQINL